MATVCARPSIISSRSSPSAPTTTTTINTINTTRRGVPAPVPNKHLPSCPTGPRPKPEQLVTPPESPKSPDNAHETSSLLSSPSQYERLSDSLPIHALTASELHAALNHIATQPLPDPKDVFPWLHGLHPENHLQLSFFAPRKRYARRSPRCLRSITIVKAGGDLSHSRLKGAVAPEEILLTTKTGQDVAQFVDADPRDGFCVRNFHIQTAKMATVSDIVVYGDEKTSEEEIKRLANRIARAQRAWRNRDKDADKDHPVFSTFVLSGSSYSPSVSLKC